MYGVGHHARFGIVALSTSDVWAVTNRIVNGGTYRLAILHFDGTSWKRVQVPDVQVSDYGLFQMAEAGPADVWAVGTECCGSGKTLTLNWSGGSWVRIASPNVRGEPIELNAVAVVPGSVWTVGDYSSGQLDEDTLAMRAPA
jgi:hypothetical protein